MRLIVEYNYELDYGNYATCTVPVIYESAEALHTLIEEKTQQYVDFRNTNDTNYLDYDTILYIGNVQLDVYYFTEYSSDGKTVEVNVPSVMTLDEFYFEVENT